MNLRARSRAGLSPAFLKYGSLTLLLATACGDDNDATPQTSSTSTTAISSSVGPTTAGSPSSGFAETTSSSSEGSTGTGIDTDAELALWPQPYQDFIAQVGGSKFVDVGDANMHYIDTGAATEDTYLLVHGLPMHTYLWRDVIPQLTDKRVIAVDLIGFGRSDRPDVAYSPAVQAQYLQAFAEALDLTNVHLVGHDLGGPVGLYWASQAPQRVVSITMFETLWSTFPGGVESMPEDFAQFLTALRTPGVGEDLAGEQNVFINGIPGLTVAGVSKEDMEVYHYPWPDAAERAAIFLPSGPRAFPFPKDPQAVAFFAEYQDFLSQTEIPKLILDVSPGALSGIQMETESGTLAYAPFAHEMFPNSTLLELGDSGHYVQEDQPDVLGIHIRDFVSAL